MNVLINMHNLNSGGGFTIGFGFLEELCLVDNDDRYTVILSDNNQYNLQSAKNVQIIKLNSFFSTFLGKLFVELKIKSLCNKLSISKIVSLTNYAIPSDINQTLLIQWPYLVYSDTDLWSKMSFINKAKRKIRKRKVLRLIKYANQIVVQSEHMKNKIEDVCQLSNVVVIPAFHNFRNEVVQPKKIEEPKKFLFPSEYYEHKNHEILVPLGNLIKEKKLNITIDITIDEEKNSNFLQSISSHNLSEIIHNLGVIPHSNVQDLYPKYDALFFPTLIETFGIPYIEAQHFGLPIFTSDRIFSREICQDYAVYFNPQIPEDILEKISSFDFANFYNLQAPYQTNRKTIVERILSS